MLREPATAGQGIVEYGLILFLTLVVTALVLGVLGGALADVLAWIGGLIEDATGGA